MKQTNRRQKHGEDPSNPAALLHLHRRCRRPIALLNIATGPLSSVVVASGPAPLPAVVGPPVAGSRDELQHQGHAGQPVEDLHRLPVQLRRSALDEELHHLDDLLPGVGVGLGHTHTHIYTHTLQSEMNTSPPPQPLWYLVEGLLRDHGAFVRRVQRLLHLLSLHRQVSLKVPERRRWGAELVYTTGA